LNFALWAKMASSQERRLCRRRRWLEVMWVTQQACCCGLVFDQRGVVRDVKRATATVGRAEATEESSSQSSVAPSEAAVVKTTPSVITFEAIDCLVERNNPLGLVYRDALLVRTGLMLPRPDVFEAALDAAVARNLERSPYFGGTELEAWWRQTTRELYEEVLSPDLYDQSELEAFDKCFEALFADLHESLLVGPHTWHPAAEVLAVLDRLREWRDERDGPRFGVVSRKFDNRLPALLRAVLGEDQFYRTFDFVATGPRPFDTAKEAHGMDISCVLHVDSVADDLPCDSVTLAPAGDATSVLPTFRDLPRLWGLPAIPEDDIVETTRIYSVYDAIEGDDVDDDQKADDDDQDDDADSSDTADLSS